MMRAEERNYIKVEMDTPDLGGKATIMDWYAPRGSNLRIDMYGPSVIVPGLSGCSTFAQPSFGRHYSVEVRPCLVKV